MTWWRSQPATFLVSHSSSAQQRRRSENGHASQLSEGVEEWKNLLNVEERWARHGSRSKKRSPRMSGSRPGRKVADGIHVVASVIALSHTTSSVFVASRSLLSVAAVARDESRKFAAGQLSSKGGLPLRPEAHRAYRQGSRLWGE